MVIESGLDALKRAEMKHADPDELAILVREIFHKSSLAEDFVDVDVGPGKFDDEGDFIRVLIRLNKLHKLSEEDADAITLDIERQISTRDDRFASIRFSEA